MPDNGGGGTGNTPDNGDGGTGNMPDNGDGGTGNTPDNGGGGTGNTPATGNGGTGKTPDTNKDTDIANLQTGDQSLVVPVALLGISAAILCGLLIMRKKRLVSGKRGLK